MRCPRCLVLVATALRHYDTTLGVWQCRESNAQIWATCPGCGDRGDAAHIAACSSIRLRQIFADGATWLLLVLDLQLQRRGRPDFDRMREAIDYAARRTTWATTWALVPNARTYRRDV